MPRTNQARTVYAEAHVAQRVKIERERAGMTFESLANRMAEAGCPIQLSALHRIEKGDPPRRITVDELVAFSRVFGITLADFVRDPADLLPGRLAELEEQQLLQNHRAAVAIEELDQINRRIAEVTQEISSSGHANASSRRSDDR